MQLNCRPGRRSVTLRLMAALLLSGLTTHAAPQTPVNQTLLVLGDSLSAEYGLPRGSGWAALLQGRIEAEKWPVQVVNASISGETTAGGISRLPALLKRHHPKVVIIELGGNDALRGLALANTQANLSAMVQASRGSGAQVLLLGMQVPPNYGKRYAADFARTYQRIAQESQAKLLPFMLAGIADRPDARDWFQADGIHPLARAHPIILKQVWGMLMPLFFRREPRA